MSAATGGPRGGRGGAGGKSAGAAKFGGGAAKRESPPHRQLEAFEALLAAAPQLPRLVLLRGDEPFFLRQALEAMQKRALGLGVELLKHDEEDPDFNAALMFNDVQSAPLFGGEQLLILRSLDRFLEKRAGDKQAAPLVKAVSAFIEAGTPGRALLLEAPGIRADHALVKLVTAAEGQILALRRLYDNPPPWNPDPRQTELVQWCHERAQKRRLRLDLEHAATVVAATGNDLAEIEAQLGRLEAAGPAAFEKTLVWQAGGSPFAVAHAALCGRIREALSGVEVLFRRGMTERGGERKLDAGATAVLLSSALISGARLAHSAARIQESGGDPLAAAGYPRAREELQERLAARPRANTWRQILEELAELDRNHKRGRSADADEFARLFLAWALRLPVAAARGAAPGRR